MGQVRLVFPHWSRENVLGALTTNSGRPHGLPLSFLESAFLTSAPGDSKTGGLQALLPPYLFVYNSPSDYGIWWGGARGAGEHPEVPGQPLRERKRRRARTI